MKNFWVRTVSAIVYAVLFLGTLLCGTLLHNTVVGTLVFAAFLLFVTVGCTFEFYRIVGKQGATPCRWLGYLFAVATVAVVASIPLMPGLSGFSMALSAMMVLPLLFAMAALAQLWYHSPEPFRDAAYTMVPMLYVAVPLSLMLSIVYDWSAWVMLMVIVLVWANDNGAYMGGSWLGKHKMWPRHSPGKTWEGTIIGVLVTLLVAVFIGPLLTPHIAWYHWLVIGLFCSAVATLGDLVESMLKRSVGMKDSGRIMPGHGGFLDRFDSLLIATPFVFVYLTLFV